MQIILVRHGQTASNRDSLALGRADVPLTELGLEQAERLGRWLSHRAAKGMQIEAIYSSPLARARDTAAAIAHGLDLPVVAAAELVEMDVGEMDGLTRVELREKYPEFMRSWFGGGAGEVKMPGGESLADVQERAWPFVERLRESHRPEAAVVAVSHNFVMRTLVCRALSIPLADFRRFEQDLASITTIELRGQRILVTALNETCHLEGLAG
jgi:broad specificity phosphatase PhoE